MVELYINSIKVDIDKDTQINFNYLQSDTTNPTAVRSSYSKTVSLKGTDTNNRIFNNLFDLRQKAMDFLPNKRVPFVLYSFGRTERGYVKLDRIRRKGCEITYECTLVHELNDFFYNLAFTEDGKALGFKDLYYGFTDDFGNLLSKEDENRKTILNWDMDYITQSWTKLYDYNPDEIYKVNPMTVITAAPTYHGYNQDVDCSKVLVYYESLNEQEKGLLPLPNGYTAENLRKDNGGFVVLTNTRELDEFEIRDLKSICQQPAIRCEFLLNAICNPENNGGYNVVFSDSIRNTPYFKDTWLVMSCLDLKENAKDNEYDINMEPLHYDGYFTGRGDLASEVPVDTSTYKDSKVELNFNLSLMMDKDVKNVHTTYGEALGNGIKYEQTDWGQQAVIKHSPYVYGGFAIRLKISNGSDVTYSSTHILTSKNAEGKAEGVKWGERVTDTLERIARLVGCESWELIIDEVDFNCNGNYVTVDDDITLSAVLPSGEDLKFEVLIQYVQVNDEGLFMPLSTRHEKGVYETVGYTATLSLDKEKTNGVYNRIPPTLQKTAVTKKTLFSDVMNPFEFLISFCKILNLKFLVDNKTVRIMPLDEYYNGVIHDLEYQIDLGSDIEIEPVLTSSKFYKFGMECPETYASTLYAKKIEHPYGQLLLDTGNYHSNETKDMFEKVKFENVIPYRLNSIYFNRSLDVCAPLVSHTFEMEIPNSSKNVEVRKGYSFNNQVYRVYDSMPKMCVFDKANETADCKNMLLFFSGFDNSCDYYVSDYSQYCEDLVGGQCYVWNRNEVVGSGLDAMCRKADGGIPCFTKYTFSATRTPRIFTHSLDFNKPDYTFLDDADNYPNSITLYSRYFQSWLGDLFNPENRKVSVRVRLNGNPKDLLRRFYYFAGNYWIIESLRDYSYTSDKPQNVTFVRINSLSAWTRHELQYYDDVVFKDSYGERVINDDRRYNVEVTGVGDNLTWYLGKVANMGWLKAVKVDDKVYPKYQLKVGFRDGEKWYYVNVGKQGKHIFKYEFETSWIPNHAFESITWFEDVTITRHTSVIAYESFRKNSLRTLKIESGYVDIGQRAFEHCTGLKSVRIDNRYNMQNGCFGQCSGLEIFKANPDGIDGLSTYCFINCTSLRRFDMMNVRVLSEGTFYGCSNLKVVNLNSNLERIEKSAFYGCARLENISIPQSVLVISSEAFALCSGLKSITLNHRQTAPAFMDNLTFNGVRSHGTLYYYQGCDIGNWLNDGEHYLGYYHWNYQIMDNPDAPEPDVPEPETGKYEVRYYVDGEKVHTDTYNEGDEIAPFAAPEKENMVFVRWDGLPSVMPYYNINVYAVYQDTTEYYSNQYFTMEATELGTGVIVTCQPSTLEISSDGVNWTRLQTGEFTIDKGGYMLIRGNNGTSGFNCNLKVTKYGSGVKVYGNIMSLLYGDDFKGKTEMAEHAFDSLFYDSDANYIVDARNLILPDTTSRCCYQNMFRNCKTLVAAPELPALNLADSCYSGMFRDCKSLAKAPELPATETSFMCYSGMFRNCESLVKAPVLPALHLAYYCYSSMFRSCKNLSEVTMLATENVQSLTIDYWLEDTAKSGTVYKNPDLQTNLGQYVPSGWEIKDYNN